MAEGQPGSEEGGPDLWQRLTEMAKKHSSEAFYALDDPLKQQRSPLFVEKMKQLDEIKRAWEL